MAGLIVEGPDGAGKTELVRKVQYRTLWPSVHLVQPGCPDSRQMFKLLKASPVIFDRFHLSTVVYGKVLRNGPELSEHEIWALDGWLKARAYKLVVCMTSRDVELENNRKTAQLWKEVQDENVLVQIRKSYLDELLNTPLEFRFYNYMTDSVDELISWVLDHRPEAPFGVIGSPRPVRWLVGDERNDDDVELSDVPFYSPRRVHAGTVLCQVMRSLNWSWCDTTVSNSVINGKLVDLASLYRDLGEPPIVIALGKQAAKRLKQAGIMFNEVPHPQYWRRFHWNDLDSYVKLMREADRV